MDVLDDISTVSEDSYKINLLEDVSYGGTSMQELENVTKALARIDLDLAYHSEKLVNLHVLQMHLLAYDTDVGAMTVEDSYISEDTMEKALVFDLLSGIIDSEVRVVESFMGTIQLEIVDTSQNISSCSDFKELLAILKGKLDSSEESLKQSQEQAAEVKFQLAKLQMAYSSLGHENRNSNEAADLSDMSQFSKIYMNSKNQTAEQQKYVLRLLEKALGRELDLDKKLQELNENEDDLKLKLHHREIVAFHMEEAAVHLWGRFLEAENSSEVFMGIAKEQFGRLQIMQFNLNSFDLREDELKHKLQDCMDQLKAKDMVIQNLESSNAKYIAENSEVPILREKARILERQLEESEFQLSDAKAKASNEANQDQICEMENAFELLKEHIYAAESRAKNAEAKVMQLTDTNLELTEEINFLKDSGNTEKVSSLEKQVRDQEIQLQHAKASTEASQEQQNKLYLAIWDMETLVEDLKSKVSKSESKTNDAEEQCIILSETNFELSKELNFMTSKVESLETSLDQANKAKVASAKEIDLRSKLIVNMITQLSVERERIQKKLYSLTKENATLTKKNGMFVATFQNIGKELVSDSRDGNDREVLFSNKFPTNTASRVESEGAVSFYQDFQVNESTEYASVTESELENNVVANNGTDMVSEIGVVKARNRCKNYVLIIFFVLLLSVSVVFIFKKEVVVSYVG